MSNQIFRKYIDIIDEAEQVDEMFGFGKKSDSAPQEEDINSVAAKLNFVTTTKQLRSYRYIDNAMVDGPMPEMSYGVNEGGPVLITTYTSDGKETQNTAEPGDIVMSGPSGEKYVIKAKKFDKLYTGGVGNTVTPEQGPRTVALYKGKPMSFTAPWGEQMIIKPGDWLVKDGDKGYYRIAKKEFKETYNVPK